MLFPMDKKIFSFGLLCLVLSGVGAIQVTIPQSLYEFARGDNMILPCSFTPKNPIGPKQIVVIMWSALSPDVDPQSILTYYYNPDPSLDIDSGYEGRASLDVNVLQGKADLKLLSLTLADNKTYECHVQIQGDSTGKPVAITRVMVLVAPSPPICKIQGTAEYGQDITLSCASAEGSPAPTYKWDRRNVQNISVPQDPKTTDKGGILSLYNISSDTSGLYICTSANKIRSGTCSLTLSVMPSSMTIGIIGRAVTFLSFLIVVIFCFFRKNRNEKKYAMGACEKVQYHTKELDKNGESRHCQDNTLSYENLSVRSPED
ncbi:cell surface A33 antigen-like [Archocentrus centrarchus]|uniref:cell surface A33 antigen-like n=1 Tax=Archocentrus centrarchus TaxID=63155 RepID=UPI0011EA509E|nr:cell surface A33 antigen-like [Archocentrus centrarchus]